MNFPKWPACEIRGKSVTEDQAAEIIVRTSGLYFTCNDREWRNILINEMGWDGKDFDELDRIYDRYRNLHLEYFENDNIASCYVGGPNGWCNWDGKIHLSGKNIGKWPSFGSCFYELKSIAKAFPYLEFDCQLFNGEYCEENIKPLVQFSVKSGEISYKENGFTPFNIGQGSYLPESERGCTIEQFRKGLTLAKGKEKNANIQIQGEDL